MREITAWSYIKSTKLIFPLQHFAIQRRHLFFNHRQDKHFFLYRVISSRLPQNTKTCVYLYTIKQMRNRPGPGRYGCAKKITFIWQPHFMTLLSCSATGYVCDDFSEYYFLCFFADLIGS